MVDEAGVRMLVFGFVRSWMYRVMMVSLAALSLERNGALWLYRGRSSSGGSHA